MAASDKAFTGLIPQIYDRLLVPMIFAPYAQDLARRIKQHAPRDVLETAAGTGALTSALAAELPATTQITATDLNEPMLAQARAHLSDKRQIRWQQADALALPFGDASFDVVACQFGAMFFPDRVKGYAEARRVLRPGGRLFFNVWDRIEENDFSNVVHQALRQVFRCFRTTRHNSWPARRMAITMKREFAPISRLPASPMSRSRRLRIAAARTRRRTRRAPCARAPRCVARSRPVAHRASRPQPGNPRRRSPAVSATARSRAGFRLW